MSYPIFLVPLHRMNLLLLISISLRCMLPTQNVTTIAQDSLGCIWLGGEDGLQRYDGYQTEQYLTTNELPYFGYINHMCMGDHSDEFLLCTTDGLYTYNYITNSLALTAEALSHQNINFVTRSTNGNILVASRSGLFIFSSTWDRIAKVHPTSDHINGLWEDGTGKVLLATDKGLEMLGNANTGYKTSMLIPGRSKFVFIDKHNRLIFNRGGQVLCCGMDELLNNEPHYRILADNLDVVRAVQIGEELWIATRGQGVIRIDLQTSTPTLLKSIYITHNDQEIRNSALTCFKDAEGLVWVGTLDGLYVMEQSANGFQQIRHSENEHSLSSNTIVGIEPNASGSEIWIATAAGINRLTWGANDTYTLQRFIDKRNATEVVSQNRFQMIHAINENKILVCTKTDFEYLNPSTGQFSNDDAANAVCRQFGMRYVRAYYTDSKQNIWTAFDEGGVGVWRHTDMTFHPIVWNDYKQDVHRTIWRDEAGYVWVSSDIDGLYRLHMQEDMLTVDESVLFPRSLFNNQCITSFAIKDSTAYIGTFNGLFTLNSRTNECQLCELPYSDTQTYISTIQQDNEGNIWVSSMRGVYRISGNEAVYFNLSQNLDITKLWYIIGHAVDSNGKLYFGGVEGLFCCAPGSLLPDTISRQPIISRFSVNNEHLPFLERDINYINDVIRLKPNQRQVAFEFASLNYMNADNIQYEYYLEGIDNNWVRTTAKRRYASYSNLPYGKFTFHVRSTNSNGIWLDNTRSVTFRIVRPWHLRWWAILLYACLGIFLGFIMLKMAMHIRRLYMHQKELQNRITNLASTPKDVEILSDDDAFLKAALELVEKNISNTDFTVDKMATTLCMSPSGLYRRIIGLTQLSPLEYIRSVRIKRAAQLLKTKRYRVYEVCSMVGFTDPRYFANCFRKEYGVTPKAYSLHVADKDSKTTQQTNTDHTPDETANR